MERRDFLKACMAGAAAQAGAPVLAADARPQFYGRARLVDEKGRAVRARSLVANRNYIFHYPFAATPCFLLDLGRPAAASAKLQTAGGQAYEWRGGIGPGRSLVAYSAICSHQLTYPTREISFISYRAEKNARNKLGAVIHCCSEHSQYDPAEGARVLAGPAPQPLAAILLEHDAGSDELHAVGTLGGEMFNEFFKRFEFRLAMEHGGAPRSRIEGTAVLRELDQYCRQQVKC